ncbi:hypothetical protein S7335_1409 [Synechococcus sp. PCC 7335]|uniref:hypothetical protein n=1 Tax=Synechococcus sp. (strain ATCC 29403 / PCC 7335) TaxID=91464 RepID=UPI00017ECAE8|nr:hypothetical protein [Synechococcus sp. PCC 7335]EDX83712.1 hypothetical protein S7335_1409 [Synechococcus sp. PCC 7335]
MEELARQTYVAATLWLSTTGYERSKQLEESYARSRPIQSTEGSDSPKKSTKDYRQSGHRAFLV